MNKLPRSPSRVNGVLGLALFVLLASSVTVKLAVWQLPPQVFNDTPGFLVPATSLLEGRGYPTQQDGFRTPTYPLFLALVLAPLDRTHLAECHDAHRAVCIGNAAKSADGQLALRVIVAAQIFLGLLTTALLFALGWRLTRNVFVALLFGAGYALNLTTAFWEISLLTETLTTFLVALAVFLTVSPHPLTPSPAARAATGEGEDSPHPLAPSPIARAATGEGGTTPPLPRRVFFRRGRGLGRGGVWLGLTLGALALCQPLFLLFWILPTAFLVMPSPLRPSPIGRGVGGEGRRAWSSILPVVLIPLAMVGLWSAYNYFANGFFTPSTLSGYLLVRMASPAIESAPPEYRDLADIYIRYRDQRLAETGSDVDTIFKAWPEMMRARGETWSALSQDLTRLGFALILADPAGYWSVVQTAWGKFWDFAFYHYDPVPAGAAQWVLWFTDLDLQRVLTVLFWVTPLGLAIVFLARRQSSLSSRGAQSATKRSPQREDQGDCFAKGARNDRLRVDDRGDCFAQTARNDRMGESALVPFAWILFVMAVVWFAALMVALTNNGDNARYRAYVLPLQYGTIVLTVWALALVARRREERQ